MLWKVLIPLCLLCLSGLASGDKDFEYLGKRKLMSADTDDKAETEEAETEEAVTDEAVTENNQLEDNTEDQTQSEEGPVIEENKTKEEEPKQQEEEWEEEEQWEAEDEWDEEEEKRWEEDQGWLEERQRNEEEEGWMEERQPNEVQGWEAAKRKEDTPKLDTQSTKRRMFNSTIVPWHLDNTFLHLFTRNQDVQTAPASGWFQNFAPDRDLVILVHGAWSDQNYIEEYFKSLSYALLNESNYNVIAVDWKHHVVPDWKEGHLAANVHFAKLLGLMLHFLFTKNIPGFFSNNLRSYYIGHDIGTIPPITFQQRFKKSFHYVYGLNPRIDLPHSNLRLAQEHGEVVAILTTYDYPYSYAHKNILALPRERSLPYVYNIMGRIIIEGTRTATFCPSPEHFKLGYCNMLPHVPIWFTHSRMIDRSYPIGKYYFYETSEMEKCPGK